jgi:hypothetical protein
MQAASYSTQVLVTTQSSDLLDDKEVETDSILAVSAEQGQTCIGPIDEASRSVLRKRLYTVGELLRIGQLFPETASCRDDGSVRAAAPAVWAGTAFWGDECQLRPGRATGPRRGPRVK